MGYDLVTLPVFLKTEICNVSPYYNKNRPYEVEVNLLLHFTIYRMMSLPDVFIFMQGSLKIKRVCLFNYLLYLHLHFNYQTVKKNHFEIVYIR